jgi:hypothetical protein
MIIAQAGIEILVPFIPGKSTRYFKTGKIIYKFLIGEMKVAQETAEAYSIREFVKSFAVFSLQVRD